MRETFKFNKKLMDGKYGEEKLLKLFPILKLLDGRKGDFDLNGKKVELKTDFYEHSKTGNFFIERFSSAEKKTNGGPWQALEHECDYFLYFYIKSGVGYCFKVPDLVKQLEVVVENLDPSYVRNIGWTTQGYKVPRQALVAEFSFSTPPLKLLAGDLDLFKQFRGEK